MFRNALAKPAPTKVLVFRMGSLGDTVVALPLLRLVERAYPHAERRMLTNFPSGARAPASSAVLEGTGLVHGYFRYTSGTRSFPELARLWWQIRRWQPDILIDLSGSKGAAAAKRDRQFLRLCGLSQQVGVPLTEDMQQPRPLAQAKTPDGGTPLVRYEHESERLARNLRVLGQADLDQPASWDLALTPAEETKAAEVLRPLGPGPFLAVSFGTKKQSNEWGTDNWAKLLVRLAEQYPEYSLVLCGAAVEAKASQFAVELWKLHAGRPAINLCGALTPRESAAVFRRASLFLGHDSGPGHLAAAVQTPCVSIFGSGSLPGVWFPYGKANRAIYHHVDCAGCRLDVCLQQGKKCILSITIDEVLTHIAQALPVRERSLEPVIAM